MNQQLIVNDEDAAMAVFYRLLDDGAAIDEALAASVLQYPATARLLSEAALLIVGRVNADHAHDTAMVSTVKSVAERVIESRAPAQKRDASISETAGSLQEMIDKLNVLSQEAAAKLGIPTSILAKLMNRLLEVATIPGDLLLDISDLIGVNEKRLYSYLQRPPMLSTEEFVGDKKPQVGERQPFLTAMKACGKEKNLDTVAYRYWLKLAETEDTSLGS
jgi:hypothetical protein